MLAGCIRLIQSLIPIISPISPEMYFLVFTIDYKMCFIPENTVNESFVPHISQVLRLLEAVILPDPHCGRCHPQILENAPI